MVMSNPQLAGSLSKKSLTIEEKIKLIDANKKEPWKLKTFEQPWIFNLHYIQRMAGKMENMVLH